MKLIHCIYASSATTAFRPEQIPEVLERARSKNLASSITGMLLFIDGSFFQVLEGDSAAVDALYDIIGKDRRHERVTQIIREPIARRSFGEWSMGFASIGRDEVQGLVGENDFFGSAACLERIDSGRAKKLLVAFGDGRWRTDKTGVHRAHAHVV
jgi:hypothetical protein